MTDTKPKAKRVTRRLAVPHRHRGILWPKDAEIDLLPHQEEFLEKRKVLAPKGGLASSS